MKSVQQTVLNAAGNWLLAIGRVCYEYVACSLIGLWIRVKQLMPFKLFANCQQPDYYFVSGVFIFSTIARSVLVNIFYSFPYLFHQLGKGIFL